MGMAQQPKADVYYNSIERTGSKPADGEEMIQEIEVGGRVMTGVCRGINNRKTIDKNMGMAVAAQCTNGGRGKII
jgi:hypothetical protein